MDSSDGELSGAPPAQKQKKVYKKTVVPPREEPRSQRTPIPRIPFDLQFTKSSKREGPLSRKKRIPVSQRVIKVARSPPRQKSPKRKQAVKRGESNRKAETSSRNDDRSSSSEEEDDEREVEDVDEADSDDNSNLRAIQEIIMGGEEEPEDMQELEPVREREDVDNRSSSSEEEADESDVEDGGEADSDGNSNQRAKKEILLEAEEEPEDMQDDVDETEQRQPEVDEEREDGTKNNALHTENGGHQSDLRREDSWSSLNSVEIANDPRYSQPGEISTEPFRNILFNAPFDVIQKNLIKVKNLSDRKVAIRMSTYSDRLEFDKKHEILDPKQEKYIEIKTNPRSYSDFRDGGTGRVYIEYVNAPDEGRVNGNWFDSATMKSEKQMKVYYSF